MSSSNSPTESCVLIVAAALDESQRGTISATPSLPTGNNRHPSLANSLAPVLSLIAPPPAGR